MPTTPTQVQRPWRTTARSVFQFVIALCLVLPFVVEATGLEPEVYPWLAGILAAAAGVTRVMALPQVEAFLTRWAPFLAADPDARTTTAYVGEHRGDAGRVDGHLVAAIVLGGLLVWLLIQVLQLLIRG